MDAVILELQVQICVGEATGTPMVCGDNLARLRLELGTDLAPPRAVFEDLALPRCLLNWRNVFPGLVVARPVSMMHRIEDSKLRLPRGMQDLEHMRDAVIRLGNRPNAIPYFASLGDEIVIRIDHQKCSDLLLISVCRHGICSFGALSRLQFIASHFLSTTRMALQQARRTSDSDAHSGRIQKPAAILVDCFGGLTRTHGFLLA